MAPFKSFPTVISLICSAGLPAMYHPSRHLATYNKTSLLNKPENSASSASPTKNTKKLSTKFFDSSQHPLSQTIKATAVLFNKQLLNTQLWDFSFHKTCLSYLKFKRELFPCMSFRAILELVLFVIFSFCLFFQYDVSLVDTPHYLILSYMMDFIIIISSLQFTAVMTTPGNPAVIYEYHRFAPFSIPFMKNECSRLPIQYYSNVNHNTYHFKYYLC